MQAWKLQTARFVFRLLDTAAPGIAAKGAYKLFITPRSRHQSTRDQIVMDSAEILHATYTEGSLVGYAWGQGPTILLVHGWEGSARNYTSLVTPLVNAGFRVVAFDAPAHGKSDGTTSNAVEYAAVLSALLTEFGPMYGVVAHSIGAVAMVYMMGTMKHRRIQRLVLVGAPCEMSDVISRFADDLNLTGRTLHHMHRLTRQRLGIPVSSVSVQAMIPYITTPGLVIHDRQDPVIPFHDAETIAEHWHDSRLVATEGLGHYKILRDSFVVEQIVDFMAEEWLMREAASYGDIKPDARVTLPTTNEMGSVSQ